MFITINILVIGKPFLKNKGVSMNSEMNMENDFKLNELKSSKSLPLKGETQDYYKRIGLVVLVLAIILINYLLMHTDKKISETNEETYTTSASPITKSITTTTLGSNAKPIVDENKLLQQKIAEAKAQDFVARLQASQNLSAGVGNNASSSSINNSASSVATEESKGANATSANITPDSNTAFLLQASNSKAQHEYATHFGPLQYVVGQGKFIFGTLAVAINSDLPGQIEAVVSEDIYGEQGSRVLIPRGSHLIGEYRSGLANNQSRLFTVWTRIKEPNGIDIQLGSEGTDSLGRAGLTGQVDYHFFDRFGSSLLVSMIGAGAATVGVNSSDQYNSSAAYRSGIAEAMSEQGKSLLNQNISIPPTINIAQGEKIVVFVNRDLDFSRVYR